MANKVINRFAFSVIIGWLLLLVLLLSEVQVGVVAAAASAAVALNEDGCQPDVVDVLPHTIPPPKYSAEAFYETITYSLASYSGYAFSHDGLSILYTSDESGVFNAYEQPLQIMATGANDNGGDDLPKQQQQQQQPQPIPLTASTTDAIYAESYFPHDRRILFSSDQGGNELDHVYVREINGTARDLTPGDNVRAKFGLFHQDGNSLYITTNERDERYFDVYQYNITRNTSDGSSNYDRELIFQNDIGLLPVAGSPDGRYIALFKSRTSADSDLYLIDLMSTSSNNNTNTSNNNNNRTSGEAAAEAVLITEHSGKNVAHDVYGFTRDSTKLIYSTNEFGQYNQAWTYDLTTGEKKVLIADDNWDVSFVTLSPTTGRYRVSGINQDGQTKITIADTYNSDEPLQLPYDKLPSGDLGQVRFSPDETRLAFRINSDTSPSNIFVVSIDDGSSSSSSSSNSSTEPMQLTNALSPDICQNYLVDGEVVRYKSFDDLEIPSILYKPRTASADNKVPALVWVHGGPGGQSRKRYDPVKQHLVNHGYAILAANNRGSSGYGKDFYHMDDRRHGEVDLQDIVYGKTYLQSLDWIDLNRIGIAGGSYGGYMTVAALAFEPDVFQVGIDIFGVTNWLRTLESIPPWWESEREALYDELGDPATDEERLRRISPLFHADKITMPLLVVQGANDPRVLKVESDEIVEALQNNNVPVEYLVFEDEGHGFVKKSNRINASEAYLSFLSKYLVSADNETAESPAAADPADPASSSSTGSHIVSLSSSLTCIVWGSLALLSTMQRLIS